MRWFRFHLLTFFRRQRVRIRQWLEQHPRVTAFLERTGSLHVEEDSLARGVAMGLFIGLTPTVGAQTLLMLAGAVLFRANFASAYLFSFVSNPLTLGPLYYGFHKVGEAFMAAVPLGIPAISGPGGAFADDAIATLVGSLLIAGPTALVGYTIAYRLWQKRLARKLARREPAIGDGESEAP